MTDLAAMFNGGENIVFECKSATLFFKIEELLSHEWWELLTARITMNLSALTSDIKIMTGGCASTDCGKALGSTIRILLDWGI
jgi:hypothetical protein